eukprot:343312-Pleurochrysis_carterae.AAC.1
MGGGPPSAESGLEKKRETEKVEHGGDATTVAYNTRPRSVGAGVRTPSLGARYDRFRPRPTCSCPRSLIAVRPREGPGEEEQFTARGSGRAVSRGWSEVAGRGQRRIARDVGRRWQTRRLLAIAVRVASEA